MSARITEAMVMAGSKWFDGNFNGLPNTDALVRGVLAAALSTEPGEAEGMVLVPEGELLFAYRGLLVLRTMFRKEKLTGGLKATEDIITRLGEIAPQLPGLSSLRAAPLPEGTHHGP